MTHPGDPDAFWGSASGLDRQDDRGMFDANDGILVIAATLILAGILLLGVAFRGT